MADAVVEDEGVGVKGEKVFGVVVADLKQRGQFALEGRFVTDGEGDLKVGGLAGFPRYEVDFCVCISSRNR